MAMINCPDCQKEISNQAEHCLHCGFPLKKPKKESPVVVPRGEGCFLQFLNVGCFIWVIIILFMILSSVLPSILYLIKPYL